MFVDNGFVFAEQQSLSGNSDQTSTNVFDALVAKKLFGGSGGRGPKIAIAITAIAGTTPNFRARLVGADNAALSSNPIILADTGVSRTLASTDLPWCPEFQPAEQLDSKRYYGVIFTQGGNSDNTATVNATGVMDAQSNITGTVPRQGPS